MKEKYILDAGVLALYFAGDRNAKKYVDKAYSGKAKVFISELNMAEFIYNYARVFGWSSALARNDLLRNSPMEIVGVYEDLTLKASKLKLKYYDTLSLADCYLIATAKTFKATIVTTDSRIRYVNEAPTVLIKLKQPYTMN